MRMVASQEMRATTPPPPTTRIFVPWGPLEVKAGPHVAALSSFRGSPAPLYGVCGKGFRGR